MAHIRPIALAVLRRGDQILVAEGYDSVKGEHFLRPPGGTIEFGEYGHEAARREIREELGAELGEVRFLATVENLFTCEGQAGHELVMLFETEFADADLYQREWFDCVEGEDPFRAVWVRLDDLGGRPLYPDGLAELLSGG